jgi:hypothetical protein
MRYQASTHPATPSLPRLLSLLLYHTLASAGLLPLVLAAGLALLLSACGPGGSGQRAQDQQTAQQRRPLNVIVLTDLSDRLLADRQARRDTAIIRRLWQQFVRRQQQQLYVKSRDRFRVVVAPQRGAQDPARYDRLIYNPEPSKRNAPALRSFQRQFQQRLARLYTDATEGRTKTADFPGADLWTYMHRYLPHDLQPDARNVLLVLTDGYLAFEHHRGHLQRGHRHNNSHFLAQLRGQNDWRRRFEQQDYGLIAEERLPGLDAAYVLELNPQHSWADEQPLLCHMWRDWLQRLGAGRSRCVGRLPLATLQQQLRRALAAPDSARAMGPTVRAGR